MNIDFSDTKIKVVALAVAALIVGASFWYIFAGNKSDEAPNFTLTDIDGNEFTLKDFEDGKVVLLDFMSTSCASCKDEMPHLVEIHEKYGDEIEMLSIDVEGDDEEDLRDFMEDYGAEWRAAIDTENVMGKYGVTRIVRVIIVDKEGTITFSHTGTSSTNKLSDNLDDAIEGKAEGVEISGGMGLATLAIGAGIFSFFSPCSFPMLPGYMSYYLAKSSNQDDLSGSDTANTVTEGTDVSWDRDEEEEKRNQKQLIKKGALSGIATALGIIVLYLIIGILVSISGELVRDQMSTLEPVMGVILIFLGIMMVENIPIGQHFKNGLMYLKYYISGSSANQTSVESYDSSGEPKGFKVKLTSSVENLISRITKKEFSFEEAKNEGYFGLFMFGIGYGAASASCTFPLFIAVILGALNSGGGIANAFFIFSLYAFAMGALMVIVTIFVSMSRQTLLNKMRSATGKIEIIGGISLEIVGIYLIWYSLNG